MPLILFKLKRVLYWGDADQRMDFTTMDDTAAFTASAALDPSSPRFLRIAGDQLSARELTAVVSEVTGKEFRLFRAGGLGMLGTLIKVARTVAPGEKQIYPVWQGMQYMRNMFDGRAKLEPLDNDRYPSIRWTTARDVLSLSVRQVSSCLYGCFSKPQAVVLDRGAPVLSEDAARVSDEVRQRRGVPTVLG
jgi:nucleoside-diphosphate-sugar epimerase